MNVGRTENSNKSRDRKIKKLKEKKKRDLKSEAVKRRV